MRDGDIRRLREEHGQPAGWPARPAGAAQAAEGMPAHCSRQHATSQHNKRSQPDNSSQQQKVFTCSSSSRQPCLLFPSSSSLSQPCSNASRTHASQCFLTAAVLRLGTNYPATFLPVLRLLTACSNLGSHTCARSRPGNQHSPPGIPRSALFCIRHTANVRPRAVFRRHHPPIGSLTPGLPTRRPHCDATS